MLDLPGTWLRIYAWSPATISLGYFQRFAQFAGLQARYPIVRRCTGGGAILHARELTFAISGAEALLPRRVEDSYSTVNQAIAEACAQLGEFVRPAEASSRDSIWCFDAPRGLDLVDARGAKVVGSAQRRRGGRFLHHGSIVLERPEGQDFCGALGCDYDDVATALARALPSKLGMRSEARELPDATLQRAAELEVSRYATRSWSERR